MKYDMTIRDIAGFCPEEAVWKMMADVSQCLLTEEFNHALSPDSVVIVGDSFVMAKEHDMAGEFLAPEHIAGQGYDEKKTVWSLGSVAYYAATGHLVFGGYGSGYQKEHPSVPLPVLPKGMQALTPIIQKCLCYSPDERVGLEELNGIATRGQRECSKQTRKKVNSTEGKEKHITDTGEKWPEGMTEV